MTAAGEAANVLPTDSAIGLPPLDSPLPPEIAAIGEEPDVPVAPSDAPIWNPKLLPRMSSAKRPPPKLPRPKLPPPKLSPQNLDSSEEVPVTLSAAPVTLATEPSAEAPAETAATAEPELVEVWRPGRSERRRERPRFRPREARKQAPQQTIEQHQDAAVQAVGATNGASDGTAATTAETSQSEPVQAETPKPARHSRHHRRRPGGDQRAIGRVADRRGHLGRQRVTNGTNVGRRRPIRTHRSPNSPP